MVVSHGVDARDLTQVLASLEEQPVLLTVEPSLQALAFLSESKSQAGLELIIGLTKFDGLGLCSSLPPNSLTLAGWMGFQAFATMPARCLNV